MCAWIRKYVEFLNKNIHGVLSLSATQTLLINIKHVKHYFKEGDYFKIHIKKQLYI